MDDAWKAIAGLAAVVAALVIKQAVDLIRGDGGELLRLRDHYHNLANRVGQLAVQVGMLEQDRENVERRLDRIEHGVAGLHEKFDRVMYGRGGSHDS